MSKIVYHVKDNLLYFVPTNARPPHGRAAIGRGQCVCLCVYVCVYVSVSVSVSLSLSLSAASSVI
jgi:hypothetical protein